MGPYQILPLLIKVKLGVMATKKYSTLPRSPELTPHHHIQFSVISRKPYGEPHVFQFED